MWFSGVEGFGMKGQGVGGYRGGVWDQECFWVGFLCAIR